MKKIVVVGGGSAGWLTALYIKKVFPSVDLTVIESTEIGILGAGEGSTPHLIDMLDFLDIPVSDLIINCDSTIKNGIKFTNWNNDNKYFYHGFGVADNLSFSSMDTNKMALSTFSLPLTSIYLNKNLSSCDFVEQISEEKRVPFSFSNNEIEEEYGVHSLFSIHFNASKIAKRLREIGGQRGVNILDGIISEIILDDQNNVKTLILENEQQINVDFVFDCTGFHRLIIGKLYNSTWKSHSDHLPVNSALPFFINMDEKIPPYTEAIAMKYGWIWKIPLQNRYGCGYVFDSSLISEEEAAKELEEFLGFEPEYPRKNKGAFKFNAGYYKEPWTNNCIAVGLASGFIEPLEATSIWVSIMSLEKVLSGIEWLHNNTQEIRNEFNKHFCFINDRVVDFIYFHYMTNRKDTPFWKKFTYENAPEQLKNRLSIWKYRMPNHYDTDLVWNAISWIAVGSGTGILNKDIASLYNQESYYQKDAFIRYSNSNFLENLNKVKSNCMDHRFFINYTKGNL